MAIEIPKPRWPGEPKPGEPPRPRPTTGAPRSVRPEIYGVMPVAQVESLLRREQMPAPFIRRMRVINLLSALTLRKIDDDMIAPFSVMDIHHILDEQISQDAIIAMLENKNLALAIETGNMQPLWAESKEETLLRRGFNQRWIQRFIATPFDPICIMLAMRAKLMLDVVDELGHSYDLLRSLGMGWIDFGEIPGEEPGNPDNYVPPLIDQPIDDPDVPVDGVPGDPDHVPGPDEPDYIPPPDRVPGDPGYEGVPGEPPGYPAGWDEAIHPGHPDYDPGPGDRGYYPGPSPGGGFYGGDYGPGGEGAPGGPYGAGGDYASLLPPLPLGYGPGWMLSGRGFGGRWSGGAIDCCLHYLDPEQNVSIDYETDTMGYNETQALKVQNYDPSCDGDNYGWEITAGGGSLSANSGLEVEYTSPEDGHGCPAILQVTLYCDGEIMQALNITFDYVYVIAWDYDTSAAEIARNGNENIYVTANNTPLTWTVSGTGFTLRDEITQGYDNVLYADETACGSATITVTGCDEQSATGYVRCTEGQWVVKAQGAGPCAAPYLTGAATGYETPCGAYIIKGNKKYFEEKQRLGQCSPYSAPCYEGCGWHGITSYNCGLSCGTWGNVGMSFFEGCSCKCDPYDHYYEMYVKAWRYYEWEC